MKNSTEEKKEAGELCLSQNSATLTCQGLARPLHVSLSEGRQFDSDHQLFLRSPKASRFNRLGAFSFLPASYQNSKRCLFKESLCRAVSLSIGSYRTASHEAVGVRGDEVCLALSQRRQSSATRILAGLIGLTRFLSLKQKGFTTEPFKSGLGITHCGIIFSLFLMTSATAFSSTTTEPTAVSSNSSSGIASFYGTECCRYNPSEGCPTASGRSLYSLVERDIPYAAAWGIPFGTKVRVTNLSNNKSVIVIILDRGPNKRFKPRRIIDLSKKAFSKIANTNKGTIRVRMEVLK
jgi:rare lipoprotein A